MSTMPEKNLPDWKSVEWNVEWLEEEGIILPPNTDPESPELPDVDDYEPLVEELEGRESEEEFLDMEDESYWLADDYFTYEGEGGEDNVDITSYPGYPFK